MSTAGVKQHPDIFSDGYFTSFLEHNAIKKETLPPESTTSFANFITYCQSSNIDVAHIVNHYEDTLLHYAVEKSLLQETKQLIDLGADMEKQDKFGNSPLLLAAKKSDIAMVKFLKSQGAAINVSDICYITPLEHAIDRFNEELIKFLVEEGAEVTNANLCNAASKFSSEMIEFLVDHGGNINGRDAYGRTPLHYAVRNKYVTNKIIELGGDVNAQDNNGNTPAHLAIGANEVIDRCGLYYRPLHKPFTPVDIFIKLRKHGADFNIQNKLKNSVLHCAAIDRNVEVCKYLFYNYAGNTHLQNEYGQTPNTLVEYYNLLPNPWDEWDSD